MFLCAVRCQWRKSQFEQFQPSSDGLQVSADEDSIPSYIINFHCDLGQVTDLSLLHCPQIKPELVIPTGLHGERYVTADAFAVQNLCIEGVK